MKSKGFTLVELLVVIAIIGLLSSVAMVMMSSSREKAKIAAGQSFDQSLRNGLGDQLAGEWLMNECSGNTASDASGNGNTATFSDSSGWATNTPNGSGCSANFTGSNYISTSLNIQSPNVTFSAWIYPTSTTGINSIIVKEAQYKYDVQDGILRALVSCNGSGWSYIFNANGPGIPTNTWSMVALTVDSVNQTATLYLNGHAVGSSGGCSITAYNETALAISSISPSSLAYPFHGNIDDIRVYTTALNLSQISKLYAESLPMHLLVKN